MWSVYKIYQYWRPNKAAGSWGPASTASSSTFGGEPAVQELLAASP